MSKAAPPSRLSTGRERDTVAGAEAVVKEDNGTSTQAKSSAVGSWLSLATAAPKLRGSTVTSNCHRISMQPVSWSELHEIIRDSNSNKHTGHEDHLTSTLRNL